MSRVVGSDEGQFSTQEGSKPQRPRGRSLQTLTPQYVSHQTHSSLKIRTAWFSSCSPYPRTREESSTKPWIGSTDTRISPGQEANGTDNEVLSQLIEAEDLRTRLQLLYHLAEKPFLGFNNLCHGKLAQAIQEPSLLQVSQTEGQPSQAEKVHGAFAAARRAHGTADSAGFATRPLTQAGRGLLRQQVTRENFFSRLFVILSLEFQHGLGLILCQPQGFQVQICQSKRQVLQSAKEQKSSGKTHLLTREPQLGSRPRNPRWGRTELVPRIPHPDTLLVALPRQILAEDTSQQRVQTVNFEEEF